MKIRYRRAPIPKIGTKRKIMKFAILRKMRGEGVFVLFEKYYCEQEYVQAHELSSIRYLFGPGWKTTYTATKEKALLDNLLADGDKCKSK